MKLVFGECFMYSTLFMAHKLSRVWSLKVKVYFGKGIRVITLMYSFTLMPDLQMINKTCRFVICRSYEFAKLDYDDDCDALRLMTRVSIYKGR